MTASDSKADVCASIARVNVHSIVHEQHSTDIRVHINTGLAKHKNINESILHEAHNHAAASIALVPSVVHAAFNRRTVGRSIVVCPSCQFGGQW